MLIHTVELALHGRNYITAGRVDREVDSRRSGVRCYTSQPSPTMSRAAFRTESNEQFTSVAVYLIGGSFGP
jgi:hypothetical protein